MSNLLNEKEKAIKELFTFSSIKELKTFKLTISVLFAVLLTGFNLILIPVVASIIYLVRSLVFTKKRVIITNEEVALDNRE